MSLNPTIIEWADFTLNPVIGCKHNCVYCYVRRLHNARHNSYLEGKLQRHKQYALPFHVPQFFPDRLKIPIKKLPKIRNHIAQQISPEKPVIFVVSMGDMFGEWVPNSWINDVLNALRNNQHYNFMLLTKNPLRLKDFDYSNNVMVGTTITRISEYPKLKESGLPFFGTKHFLSIEPIQDDFSRLRIFEELGAAYFDAEFIIVGAMSGKGNEVTKKEYLESVYHKKVYYKRTAFDILGVKC